MNYTDWFSNIDLPLPSWGKHPIGCDVFFYIVGYDLLIFVEFCICVYEDISSSFVVFFVPSSFGIRIMLVL